MRFRPDSDMAFAHRSGIRSALVMTGCSSNETLEKVVADGNPELVPHYWVNSLGDLSAFV